MGKLSHHQSARQPKATVLATVPQKLQRHHIIITYEYIADNIKIPAILHRARFNHMMASALSFLSLPAEIRIVVYEMMALQATSLVRLRRNWTKPRDYEIARFSTSSLPFLYCRNSSGARSIQPTVFRNLRLCCQQTLAETKRYICLPLVNLAILESRLLEFCSAPETIDLLNKSQWLQSQIKEIEIRVWYFGTTLSHYPGEEAMFFPKGDNHIPRKSHKKMHTSLFNSSTERGRGLKPIAQYLMTLPNLENVYLTIEPSETTQAEFFKAWNDPLGDAEALYPLKQRGVQVRIRLAYQSEIYRPSPKSMEFFYTSLEKLISRKKFWRRIRGMKTDERVNWDYLTSNIEAPYHPLGESGLRYLINGGHEDGKSWRQ